MITAGFETAALDSPRTRCIVPGLTPRFSGLQRSAYALDKRVVRSPRAFEIEYAAREEPVTPRWTDVEVVFQDCRAELVVVVVPSLHEDQTPGSADQVPSAAAVLQVLAYLSRRLHSVSTMA